MGRCVAVYRESGKRPSGGAPSLRNGARARESLHLRPAHDAWQQLCLPAAPFLSIYVHVYKKILQNIKITKTKLVAELVTICMYIYVYIYIRTYIYIHTHIYIYTIT